MEELSLHILDIAKNSVKANARLIEIKIEEKTIDDLFIITITDNGCGMSAEMLKSVTDPFFTSRKTRKVGLGLPLFKSAAEQTGGNFRINSTLGIGTTVTAEFIRSNIDRAPLGDIAATVSTLIGGSPNIDFIYNHIVDGKSFNFSTVELKNILNDIPLDSPQISLWISEYIKEGLSELL